jgi:hypothetical protein
MKDITTRDENIQVSFNELIFKFMFL